FTWPEIEENTGYICTCAPLEFGTLNKISPSQIDKISKSCTFEKPIHNYTIHTRPLKLWTIPLMSRKENIQEDQVILEVEEEQTGDMDIDPISKSAIIFVCGCALSENFKKLKMNANEMHEELLKSVTDNEISKDDVPKVPTITN
ncbi:9223_t:CDS:2, partial [Funneliformis geosporum]